MNDNRLQEISKNHFKKSARRRRRFGKDIRKIRKYTAAVKAIGFALEQPLHVVMLVCPASGILNSLSNESALSEC
jgi:hypothetical protein